MGLNQILLTFFWNGSEGQEIVGSWLGQYRRKSCPFNVAMLHPHAEGHHGFLEVCGLPGAQVFGLCMTPKPDGSGACCSRIVRTRNQVVRTAQHVALGYVVELLGLRDFFHGNIRRECSWLWEWNYRFTICKRCCIHPSMLTTIYPSIHLCIYLLIYIYTYMHTYIYIYLYIYTHT